MARFIVTGGGGFIGRSLASVIQMDGHEVIIASRGLHRQDSNSWVEYDLQRPETIANLIALQPDGVFHLAWSTVPASAEHGPGADISTNVAGSAELFRALSDANVRTVFVSSGGTVYGITDQHPVSEDVPARPISAYGMSKLAVEQYAELFRRSHGFDVRIGRLSNPYGVNVSESKAQGAVSIFARRLISGDEIVIMGDGSVIRDYVDVSDAAKALYDIMMAGPDQSRDFKFNVGCGTGTSLKEVISLLEERLGATARIKQTAQRRFDVPYNVLDISKINREIGWRPKISFRDGLDELIRKVRGAYKS